MSVTPSALSSSVLIVINIVVLLFSIIFYAIENRTFASEIRCLFFFLFSGGWGKIKLQLTTLPRIFIRVVCRFNSVAFRCRFQFGEFAHLDVACSMKPKPAKIIGAVSSAN